MAWDAAPGSSVEWNVGKDESPRAKAARGANVRTCLRQAGMGPAILDPYEEKRRADDAHAL
jgi:hypothetical protein